MTAVSEAYTGLGGPTVTRASWPSASPVTVRVSPVSDAVAVFGDQPGTTANREPVGHGLVVSPLDLGRHHTRIRAPSHLHGSPPATAAPVCAAASWVALPGR